MRSDEFRAEASAKFKEKNQVKDNMMKMVDGCATVTHVVHRMLFILEKAPSRHCREFCKNLFDLKKSLDDDFPIQVGQSDISEMCPICIIEDDELSKCPHKPHIRAALLLMALFRVHPDFDLDEDPNEGDTPDLDGEGMVEK
jgi:hypothetical protein